MTSGLGGLQAPARRARPRGRLLIAAIAAVGGLALFALGVALGQALESSPHGGETQTSIRTLFPATLEAETVTVTVTDR